MAVIGCYTMDIYCDRDGDPYGSACRHRRADYTGGAQAQYTGDTEAWCIRHARADGWKFNRSRTAAICPECAKEGARP